MRKAGVGNGESGKGGREREGGRGRESVRKAGVGKGESGK